MHQRASHHYTPFTLLPHISKRATLHVPPNLLNSPRGATFHSNTWAATTNIVNKSGADNHTTSNLVSYRAHRGGPRASPPPYPAKTGKKIEKKKANAHLGDLLYNCPPEISRITHPRYQRYYCSLSGVFQLSELSYALEEFVVEFFPSTCGNRSSESYCALWTINLLLLALCTNRYCQMYISCWLPIKPLPLLNVKIHRYYLQKAEHGGYLYLYLSLTTTCRTVASCTQKQVLLLIVKGIFQKGDTKST